MLIVCGGSFAVLFLCGKIGSCWDCVLVGLLLIGYEFLVLVRVFVLMVVYLFIIEIDCLGFGCSFLVLKVLLGFIVFISLS